MKKEEFMNSIYSSISKAKENPEYSTIKTDFNNPLTVNAELKTSTTPNNSGIETIKITYDDSIYNIKNYGYEQQENYEDYYGSGNKNYSNQANAKKGLNNRKQKNKNTNPNDNNNGYYEYDYQYDEGYENNNYHASNRNYYDNSYGGGYDNKQSHKGKNNNNNNNNNYEY